MTSKGPISNHDASPSPREIFEAWAHDYAEATAAATWNELTASQTGCHSSLAFGAGGIALGLFHAGRYFAEESFLEAAERWCREASARRDDTRAFLEPPYSERYRMPARAFFFGPAGLDFVRVLTAHAVGDQVAVARASVRYRQLARTAGDGLTELYKGCSGGLLGAAVLRHHLETADFDELGNELFDRLLRSAVRDDGGFLDWRESREPGLGHGTGGVYHAMLLWSQASGRPFPEGFESSLARFLEHSLAHPILVGDRVIKPKLCGGFAGLAVVAAKAHEALAGPDPGEMTSFLVSARRLAGAALDHAPPRPPHLCCGRLGMAAAALTLARTEPHGDWRRRAEELAISAMLYEDEAWDSVGLLTGQAGLCSMALALAGKSLGRIPGFDLVARKISPERESR